MVMSHKISELMFCEKVRKIFVKNVWQQVKNVSSSICKFHPVLYCFISGIPTQQANSNFAKFDCSRTKLKHQVYLDNFSE